MRWELLSAVACVLGGLILLSLESASSGSYSLTGQTVFEGIAHGVGLYCIGKGLFVALSVRRADAQIRLLDEIAGYLQPNEEEEEEMEPDVEQLV